MIGPMFLSSEPRRRDTHDTKSRHTYILKLSLWDHNLFFFSFQPSHAPERIYVVYDTWEG
jgi:hypothetical protein